MARTGILALPPELLDLVFRRIVRWHESEIFLERDRCTLAALARTCRTFHDPALDILWYELSSLLPLLSTLPPDLCVITRKNNASDELHESVTFLRYPLPADLARLRIYASRVRILDTQFSNIRDGTYLGVNPTTLRALLGFGPIPLFPCLRSLIYVDFVHSVGYLVFASTLDEVVLKVCDAAVDLPHNLDHLATLCHDITKLRIVWDWENSRYRGTTTPSTSLTASFIRFSHLKSLSIMPIDITSRAVWILGSLPQLRELQVHTCTDGVGRDTTSYEGVQGLFPVLRELTLYTSNLTWSMHVLLDAISSPQLDTLDLNYGTSSLTDHPSLLRELFQTLKGSSFQHSLRVLDINCQQEQSLPCDMTDGLFTPLLGLSALTRLTMFGWDPIIISDDTLEAMSRAWPNLEHLNLQHPWDIHECSHNTPLKATLAGLIPFAYRCPHLHTLHVAVNPNVRANTIATSTRTIYDLSPSVAPGVLLTAPVPPGRSRVTDLYLGCAEPDVPAYTAALISAVFPRVESVGWEAIKDGRMSNAWPRVHALLLLFAETCKPEVESDKNLSAGSARLASALMANQDVVPRPAALVVLDSSLSTGPVTRYIGW